jgi:hypothetical protein
MWGHLIKLVSVGKGALVIGVAASAAMVSSAEVSNGPSHQELPSATPSALVTSAAPKPSEKPSTGNTTTPAASPKTEEKHLEVSLVVKACVAKYLAVREQGDGALAADRQAVEVACKAALTATGLSSADFWTKFGLDKHSTAGKTEPNTAGPEAQVKECVRQYLAGTADASDACRNAIAASGLTPQAFWTKFGPHADRAKVELSVEAQAMIRECVTKYTAKSPDATATCKRAIELTGLTSAEFGAKFLLRTTEPKPATTPKPATKPAELSQLVAKCLELYKTATTTGETKAVSEACGAAVRASGLSSADFWAKYHPTTN